MEATNEVNEEQNCNLGDEPYGINEPVTDLDGQVVESEPNEQAADNDPNGNEQDIENKKSEGNGKRSIVWRYFFHVKGPGSKVKCCFCSRIMAAGTKKNGTASMLYHLKHVCKKSELYKQEVGQTKLRYKSTTKGESMGGLGFQSFHQEKARKSLARMCVKDNRPFSIVDDEGFKEFVWDLNPMFKFPSRWTVARDCLSLHQEEKNKLKKLLKNQTVSLTTDTWTSVQNYNYMCLTAHWVDENWILRKKVLNFCQISNHKGVTIGKLVYRCLQEWGIDKVFTVTVDNASSNDGAIRHLRSMLKGSRSILDCKYMHLRCCAHIINLVVRDGLDEQFATISKIRNAVKFLRSSPSRYDSFLECVESEKIDYKHKPCLDVDTRWNSTFLMLEAAMKYKSAFDRLHCISSNYRTYFNGEVYDEDPEGTTRTIKKKKKDKVLGAPIDDDWEKASNFMEFLGIFFNVTKKVSGNKYVTSNLFVGELVKMHAAISRMCLNVDEKKRTMARSMKEKYDKYWDNLDNMNLLLYVVLVLDPRNKLSFLDYCLELIYGTDRDKIVEVTTRVNNTLKELFGYYKRNASNENETVFSSSTPSFSDNANDLDLDDGYEKYLENRGVRTSDTELQIYLKDGTEKRIKGDEKFDVLGWWKHNTVKFPVLSQVAKHVFGMPISTVASESAFSTGGRVIDKYRSSLTPKTAEALICTQDWMRSTPADLQEMPVNGQQLEDLTEQLENLEIDYFEKGTKSGNDSSMDEDFFFINED